MTKVKICGLMTKQDVELCVQAGAHMLGFVVDYPLPVPWNLTRDQAKDLITQVPPHVKSCIVTGGSVRKILAIAENIHPQAIQLHYKETLQEVKELTELLHLQGIKTIKALRIDAKGNCDFEITNPLKAARELAKINLAAILVDSYTPSKPGGTGITLDLTLFRKIQEASSVPVILAGGLNPTNLLSIITTAQPYAVDVLTGLERKPGFKDKDKIKDFMEIINS